MPATDLVTVYRDLDAFEAIHALQRIPLENGTQLFELTAPGEHYHHLICRSATKLNASIYAWAKTLNAEPKSRATPKSRICLKFTASAKPAHQANRRYKPGTSSPYTPAAAQAIIAKVPTGQKEPADKINPCE